MTQQLCLLQEQSALRFLQTQLGVRQPAEDFGQSSPMLVPSLTEHENVVQIDHYIVVQQIKEHMIHSSLKGCRRIAETHRHD